VTETTAARRTARAKELLPRLYPQLALRP